MEATTSPKITKLEWGRMSVEGSEKEYKDLKVWPGGARAWDWKETGTRHLPGIQVADVEELVENGAKKIIFGRGHYERLSVESDTWDYLEDNGVEVEVAATPQAVEKYNEIREQGAIGGLFHSTC